MSAGAPSPTDRVNDVDRIARELRRAVREALNRHRLAGNPVAVWRDGRVQWIPASEIPVEPEGDVGKGV